MRLRASFLRGRLVAVVLCLVTTAHADLPTPHFQFTDDFGGRYDALFRFVALRSLAFQSPLGHPPESPPFMPRSLRLELDHLFRVSVGAFLFGGGILLASPAPRTQLKLNPRALLRPGVPIEGGEIVFSTQFF